MSPDPVGERLDTLLRTATAVLAGAGVPSPGVDAEILLAHAAGRQLGDLRRARVLGEDVPDATRTAFVDLIERRARRVPLQHLTGVAHFGGVELEVGPGVFVPRPETEVMLGLALEALGGLDRPTVVDLCTGSGAVALALALARPDARVGAVELSDEAHGYAVRNVARAGLPVDLRLGRAQDAFGDWAGEVDVVVTNPPYIPPDAVPVDVEVREHDPELALYGGGPDGLQVPLEVGLRAAELLRAGGVLLMEHADVQGGSLPAALAAQGRWAQVEDHRDLAGLPRVTRAVRDTART
ncbi:peptide chain release factor N(5)-glutamine methyltransferase [Ornithinimicrobium sp. LYQ121]|uniref:peptide chain release factor N(5)-glutamine methyltransferase n=1 Tax=Ornithinimicrobium sp. LYQ121 TaxID=3378801 RepID=UPI003853F58B